MSDDDFYLQLAQLCDNSLMHNRSSMRDDADSGIEDQQWNRPKNPAAVALGRLGGQKGGPARAAALSSEKRSEIARRAAQTRWKKNP